MQAKPSDSLFDGRRPACADECAAVVRDGLAELGVEANVSWLPPEADRGYEDLGMRCPHGVRYYAEPTNEQIARFVAEKTS